MNRIAKTIMSLVVCGGTVTLFGTEANAKVFIKPSMIYMSNSSNNGTVDATESRMNIDLMGGYSGEKGWTLGFYYGTEKGQSKSTTTTPTYVSTSTTDISRTSLGLSGGWISNKETGGPYALATYFFSSSYIATPNDYKGSGIQADFGYRVAIKRAFFALQFSYKAFTYPEYTYGGTTTTLDAPLEHGFIDPYFTMFFQF